MSDTLQDTGVVSQIEAWLADNPDPEIPCEHHHPGGLACNDDGHADWYRAMTCGCTEYVCQSVRDRWDNLSRNRVPMWDCRTCGSRWYKAGDTTTWRRIR